VNDSLPDVILLKGAPGVGKSSAAKFLTRHFSSGVRIEVDELRRMVIGVNWTDQSEHRAVLRIGAQLVGGFLRAGFAPIILVDTFSGDKLDGFLHALRAEQLKARPCVIVLHASDETLRDRISNREANGFRDLLVSTRINCEVVRDAKPFEKLIDTSALSPPEVAQAIMSVLEREISETRMGDN